MAEELLDDSEVVLDVGDVRGEGVSEAVAGFAVAWMVFDVGEFHPCAHEHAEVTV